jgi:hypothetical protein
MKITNVEALYCVISLPSSYLRLLTYRHSDIISLCSSFRMTRRQWYSTLRLRGAGIVQSVPPWVTGRPRNPGSIPRRGKIVFSSPQCSDWLWGPPSFLSNGYLGLLPGLNLHVREVDHWPPPSSEVRNGTALASDPIGLHGVMLKHRNNSTCTFY